jgi:hypothetical protein
MIEIYHARDALAAHWTRIGFLDQNFGARLATALVTTLPEFCRYPRIHANNTRVIFRN